MAGPWVSNPALLRDVEHAKAAYFTQRAQALIGLGREMKVGRFGHATALLWPTFNRVYAFEAGDLSRLDDLLSWYAEEEQEPVFEIAPLEGHTEVFRALGARGFAPTGTQAVVAGPSAGARPASVPVRWVDRGGIADWAALYIRAYGWDVPDFDNLTQELRAQYEGPHWHLCVGDLEGRPVAMGALWTGRPVAYLANAATLPDYRGRGCQQSVLAARCARASSLGHEFVASDTEPFAASLRNLERAGLRLLCHKARWERRPRS